MKIALPDLEFLSPNAKRAAIGVVLATVVGTSTWIGLRLSNANATPPAEGADAAAAAGSAAATGATPSSAPAAPAQPMPTTVEIQFSTSPSVHASVFWGKTLLGRINPHAALVVTRPRDSGPLDVIVRAVGYLPVHTRAHTFADSKLGVKLTRPDQKNTLFGYRAPLDAGTDSGASPLPSSSTPAPDLQQQPPQ